MPFRFVAAILTLSTFALAAVHSPSSPPDRPGSPRIAAKPAPVPIPPEIATADLAAWLEQTAVDAYLADQWVQVTAYLDALEATRLAEAARAAQAARPVSRPSVGSTVGECTGFAVPDYIIQRESGGNPSAYNPSGAYGCAQTLLSHYSGGACRGLDPYTIDGQRQCVWILSNGGTNLAPWSTR